jgi:glycosyltransferase involved in cell wall biosynthesis
MVTPSFNQARFLESTVRSILLQGYPNLEYFVLDGGSTDGSLDIIRKYEPWITHWVSEPDGGQSAAINRGLRVSSGTFFTWINSDDMLYKDALANHAKTVGFDPGVVYIGDCLYMDQSSRPLNLHRGRVHNFEDLVRVKTVWRAPGDRGHVVQPEVIFPRALAMAVGGLNEANHRTMDYELWGRFLLAGAKFHYTGIPFAMFRLHDDQKTGQAWITTKSLIETAIELVNQAHDLRPEDRSEILAELHEYQRDYWRATGPLARLGLPPDLVLRMRSDRAALRRRTATLARRWFG